VCLYPYKPALARERTVYVKVIKMPGTPHKKKVRAPRNRTLEVDPADASGLSHLVHYEDSGLPPACSCIVCGDAFSILPKLEPNSFDLLFADPPYNLSKNFGKEKFREQSLEQYQEWLDSWLRLCIPLLKKTASIYICGDWRSGSAIERAGSRYFTLRNRITWEREKGRGSKTNWKNAAEDIWFFTASDDYTFNLEAVKQRRRVLAPYTADGVPKDWQRSDDGGYRDTHPSNIWTDISVPFWSMPENTDHPTQKPEKLLAKIILGSTDPNDRVLDPFAGSGTTAVTAKKLGRDFVAIESDEQYCLLAQKRLEIADTDNTIQGFADGVFWERNSKIIK
jgi:site-specific DNA-methyltransferase (adenine-specific)